MAFFNQFTKTNYSINNDGVQNRIIDLFRYVDVKDKLADGATSYSYIDILDGERPDNLSHRLYGTPDYYWTFFILNDELKDGLGVWPKSYNELASKISNDFSNIAVFNVPTAFDTSIGVISGSVGKGSIKTSAGNLPIEKYKQYLKYAVPFDTFSVSTNDNGVYSPLLFSAGNIIHYDAEMQQLWIDKSTVELYAPQEYAGYQTSNNSQKSLGKTQLYTLGSPSSYRILFVNPYEKGNNTVKSDDYYAVEALRLEWQEAVREAAIQNGEEFYYQAYNYALQEEGNRDENYSHVDYHYQVMPAAVWQNAKDAPAYYTDIERSEIKTAAEVGFQFDSGSPPTSNYVSLEKKITDENDARKRLRYVLPTYIQSFAREFKRLINE